MTEYIFVYGSLMDGFFNYDKYLKGKVLTSKKVKTTGKLFHMKKEGYPALLKGDDVVYGELITIKDFENNLKAMDAMEGFLGENNPDNEYNRMLIDVQLLDTDKLNNSSLIHHETIKAYAYMYNYNETKVNKDNLVYIKHGDWRKYMNT
ncbi:gamma-glutamylcyclotransferase family protein [Hathewaya histolytica]|uniref:gamma-glutamylcyclotransferase family protein n=1 Tax=Hathewaya histolytica TaxID=1498 RepID=UPI003B682028